MRIIQLNLKGTVPSRSDTANLLHMAGDAVLVERGRPRLLILKCPCGCGEIYATNLDRQAGKAWRLYRKRGAITIFPSIWRDTGCQSHFIIAKDQIYLLGKWFEEESEENELWANKDMLASEDVLNALSNLSFESVELIADRIDALPWDVLKVCRRLVYEKTAVEGIQEKRGHFKRR